MSWLICDNEVPYKLLCTVEDPNLNENGQKSNFLRSFSDSEHGQHFVEIRH